MMQFKEGKMSADDVLTMVAPVKEESVEVKSVVPKVAKVEEKVEDSEVRILTFGDMMLGRYVRTLMDKYGKDFIFENLPKGSEFFPTADIVFGNLEGPIKGKGKKGGTSMIFSFNEDVAPLLKDHGFNLVSIANNHALDQGWDGRDTTIKALDAAGLSWCGHPTEETPESVYYGTYGDRDIAFVCLQDITSKIDMEGAQALIKEVRPNVDYLIVSVHWGPEYKNTAHPTLQVEKGHQFVDAGADFVIGHHPHVVQNFEIYNGKFIFYSLGNFVFDQYWSQNTQKELAINISLDDASGSLKTTVNLIPMKSDSSKSRLMTEEEKKKWLEEFIGYGTYDDSMKEQIRAGVVGSSM